MKGQTVPRDNIQTPTALQSSKLLHLIARCRSFSLAWSWFDNNWFHQMQTNTAHEQNTKNMKRLRGSSVLDRPKPATVPAQKHTQRTLAESSRKKKKNLTTRQTTNDQT